MPVATITPTELEAERQRAGSVDLIDVRTSGEYRRTHAASARSVPLDHLNPAEVMNSRAAATDRPLYLICRSGRRSRQAVAKFQAAGLPNIVNVEGGMIAWERAGLPIVRGAGPISLERQVRIAAGSLVVLGTTLGAFVHPAFLALAGFVGAGLVFAGVTDTCGMGLILARMPWNRSHALKIDEVS